MPGWTCPTGAAARLLLVLAGAALTTAAAARVLTLPTTYSSQVDVVFLLPLTPQNPNSLQFRSESLIDFAAVAQRTVSASQTGAAATSDEVTLTGQGVRHGFSVRLPNSGGQWATNFDRPVLDVQAVGSSPDEVLTTMQRILQAIRESVSARQVAAGVTPAQRVAVSLSPGQLPVFANAGSHLRALGATLLLGGGLTALAATRRSAPGRKQPVRATGPLRARISGAP